MDNSEFDDFNNNQDNIYENDEEKEEEEKINTENEIIKELKKLFKIAKNCKKKEEALEKYNEIIDIENKKEINPKNYSFKSYSELCLNSIEERNIEDFTKYFSEIQKLLSNENHRINQEIIKHLISNILNKFEKMSLEEIKEKEIFLNKIVIMVLKEKTSDFYGILQDYIDNNYHKFTIIEQYIDGEKYPKITLNITFPNINILNFKKVIFEEKELHNKKFEEIKNFILTPLSNGKFIYYYENDDDEKFIFVSEKNDFTNEIQIETKYKCFDIKELDNDDIILCLEKNSEIIRIDYEKNKYEIIYIFELLNFTSFNYFVELTKNLICFGNDEEGYYIYNKINNNKYEFIYGVHFKNEKKKVYSIDNKSYLTYSFVEETYEDDKIELKFYDIQSFNFFGKTSLKVNSFYGYGDKFFQLNYIQKYFLLVGYYNTIWIINLKSLKILHNIQLENIKEIRVLKDSSFLIFYNDFRSKYENYFFDGKNLIKKWEGKSNAHIIEILDDFDFVFIYKGYYSNVKISHMELKNKISNDINYN